MKSLPAIAGYEILTRLGGGPLTSVYAAREVGSDMPCAVKVLRTDWEDQPTAIKLLQREARACLAVQHPHLITLREAHVTRPPYYLVMDLLSGESLRRRLRRDYRLPVTEAIWITRQMADALAALHKAGFVHGDIKPDNIRLVEGGNAILLDLGFAHRPGENQAFVDQGYILGTVDYLAPEQCSPDQQDDLHSDLFSLGVTLFEMLTGQLPYPRGSVNETVKRHECDPPSDVRRYVRGLPAGLHDLLQGLLSRRPGERPTASEVVTELVSLEIALLRRRQVA